MLETVLLASLGCTLLGLGCWNIHIHRSMNQIRARHASERARADAALQALAACVAGLDTMARLPVSKAVSLEPEPVTTARRTREAQALELASRGAGYQEIAKRLSMRPADVELLLKVSEYRRQAG